MKRLLHIACLALIVVVLAAGCRSHSRVATEGKPSKDASSTTTARTYTLINFEGTAEGLSFSGQMRVADDSLIWMTVSKFVEVGRAIATPDSVMGYSRLLGRTFAGTYADLEKRTKERLTFAQLQAILRADDMEELIAKLAKKMGYTVQVRVTQRATSSSLSFPFNMPSR